MTVLALTRAVPDSMETCELTHLARTPIDLDAARAQHAAYEAALRSIGCRVERIEPLPQMPDSVFVEDTALVFDEVAVATRPGAESRRGEIDSVVRALQPYRRVVVIAAPGTIDGGDVLRVGRRVFVGLSSRTNDSAIEQLKTVLEPHGYEIVAVPVGGVLHLKSAITQVGPSTLLVNREWIDVNRFEGYELIDVDPSEPGAANALLVNEALLFPSAFPRTRARLAAAGSHIIDVDASEVAKAEGALTCCSILLRA